MPYTITNRTSREVLLRLRSGVTVHLAAGARTTGLDGAEINGNPRIASLVDRRMVAVEDATSGGGRARRSGRETAKPSGKKTSSRGASGDAEETSAGGSK